MASSKEYLDFILEQVSELDNISYSIFKRESVNKSKKVLDKTLHAEHAAESRPPPGQADPGGRRGRLVPLHEGLPVHQPVPCRRRRAGTKRQRSN